MTIPKPKHCVKNQNKQSLIFSATKKTSFHVTEIKCTCRWIFKLPLSSLVIDSVWHKNTNQRHFDGTTLIDKLSASSMHNGLHHWKRASLSIFFSFDKKAEFVKTYIWIVILYFWQKYTFLNILFINWIIWKFQIFKYFNYNLSFNHIVVFTHAGNLRL